METLDLIRSNLLSPMVLGFLLGVIAAFVKSDLRVPEPLYVGLSMYLLLAIGLKGGVALSETTLGIVWLPAVATVCLGLLTTLIAFWVSRCLWKLDMANAAALAAHYGSVSAVTFMAALTFVRMAGAEAEGYLPGLVALLEIPAIFLALILVQRSANKQPIGEAIRETLTGKSILLLAGGLLIGGISGREGMEPVKLVFVDAFPGLLVLFLVEMGIVAGRRMKEIQRSSAFLVAFAIGVPIINGAIGVVVGVLCGLSLGGSTVLGVMTASASYIAAPAAVRVGIPSANPSYYLTAALGVTFPFNLTLGIPLFYELARFAKGMFV